MHRDASTPNNAAMLLIDHQVGTMTWTHSHDISFILHACSRSFGEPVRSTLRH